MAPVRRITVIVACLAIAGVALSGRAAALDDDEARHLLSRTGFGLPAPDEIRALRPLSRSEAVETLLRGVRRSAVTPPPTWVRLHMPTPKIRKTWSHGEKRAYNKTNRARWRALQQWWVREMLVTPSPLTERMVLFWHNHFTSSFEGVKWPPYLQAQNARFRRHAVGDFKVLLREMITDPAMLFYLDGRRNRAKKPNENFARELLELFTMGEGQGYTEHDIQEAARALTGWTVDEESSQPVFRAKQHDGGEKAFLGHRGHFGVDDIVAVLLAHPRPARYLAERAHRAFIGGNPSDDVIEAAAAAFRRSGYQVSALLRSLLTSVDFWAPENRGTKIKSPVDLVVGLTRLARWQGETELLVNRMRDMGQRLFRPPNVKGWPGGAAWINSTSLTARNSFTYAMAKVLGRGEISGGNMGMMAKAMGQAAPFMTGPAHSPTETERMLLAVPMVRTVNRDSMSPAAHLLAVLRDPAFQMK